MVKQVLARVTFVWALMFLAFNAYADCGTPADAEALVSKTTDKVLEALKAEKAEKAEKADPCKVYTLVEKAVLPNFDFDKMSTLVLGRCGRGTSRDQKKLFSNEFQQLLVRTYSTALVEAAGKVERIDYSSKDTGTMGKRKPVPTALVSAKVYQKGKSSPIEVDYAMYCDNKGWKVYNISVGGPSLVTNYRQEFCDKIRSKKMDGLIEELRTNRLDNEAKKCK
jgi:phospholipid transport system substrate-binding protein